MSDKQPWQQSEAELVAEFLRRLDRDDRKKRWKVYPETADWDLLLVDENGVQVGIEAKLTLNAKAIDQALVGVHSRWAQFDGPDYRAVLVPAVGRQQHLARICGIIGIGLLVLREEQPGCVYSMSGLEMGLLGDWACWGPAIRCPLPDYVPDVQAGVKSPVKLTDWKVRAIKLSIMLDRRGWVDRGDMRALGISPSRWTDPYQGFLRQEQRGQYVRSDATPDFRAQHPENYAQIEADVAVWGRELDPFKQQAPDWLTGVVQ